GGGGALSSSAPAARGQAEAADTPPTQVDARQRTTPQVTLRFDHLLDIARSPSKAGLANPGRGARKWLPVLISFDRSPLQGRGHAQVTPGQAVLPVSFEIPQSPREISSRAQPPNHRTTAASVGERDGLPAGRRAPHERRDARCNLRHGLERVGEA